MSNDVRISVEFLPHGEGLPLPKYQTAGSAGLDLAAALADDAPLTIKPGDRILMPTGMKIALPSGYEAQIRPRSGLALKHGITVLNAPGTIDSDYRGEVMALMINLGSAPHTFRRGDRIAQLVVQTVARAEPARVDTLDASERGDDGFGSTG